MAIAIIIVLRYAQSTPYLSSFILGLIIGIEEQGWLNVVFFVLINVTIFLIMNLMSDQVTQEFVQGSQQNAITNLFKWFVAGYCLIYAVASLIASTYSYPFWSSLNGNN